MTSRERLINALNHIEPDRPPIDLGATTVTGISAVALDNLRHKLGLPEKKVQIHEPFQILGNVTDDVRQALGVDAVGIFLKSTFFGYKNDSFKGWQFQNKEFEIGSGFTTTIDENGDTLVYPQGDLTAKPSGRLPKDGYYFDGILRQEPVDEDNLNAKEDFKNDFSLLTDKDLRDIENQANDIYKNTDYGSVLAWGGAGLGDVAKLPGTSLTFTPGVRDIEEWYMYHLLYPEYIEDIFDYQIEISIKNLQMIKEAVGNKPQAIFVSGTDFGTQIDTIISTDLFRKIYKPRYMKINDWIHKNTTWKTFFHSCGAISNIIPDFIEMGVDILNPVQCSAKGMGPKHLKEAFGDKITFWGGASDTQKTLPFGTPEEVIKETRERNEIFKKGGGYVFNPIHNIQAPTSPENIIALYNTVKG